MSKKTIDELDEIIEALQNARDTVDRFSDYDFALDAYLRPLSQHAGNLSIAVTAQRDLIKETE